ncbi:flagellin N-terminal helical domain-containing protein [Pseudovibrio sp. WM33]|uniref:flagellin N-terminal helical domain-containing protein n=1 Tax=Pseudovibrio sp. WM33 TaxID=1735585 RepID=UPI0007AE45CE|nr:flagellin [Pseudovibrio sp. WM33]KZL28293.1 Flagellin [Pseudovibrio sp. WM33]
MSSLLTNTSAMVALSNLRSINNDMATTQSRISTGMRVNDASDNAAYWSIATTMRSDNAALGAVKDAIGLGKATVDIAFTAADSSQEIMKQMVAKLTSATSQSQDGRAKIQQDLNALQDQLRTNANSATFNGDNWLAMDKQVDNLNPEITGSFTRDSAGNATLEKIGVDLSAVVLVDTDADAATNSGILTSDGLGAAGTAPTAGTPATAGPDGILGNADDVAAVPATVGVEGDGLIGAAEADFWAKGNFGAINTDNLLGTGADAKTTLTVLNFDISKLEDTDNDNALLEGLIDFIDGKSKEMTDAATTLGSAKMRIDMQLEFVNTLTDAVDRGIGQLVDADMNAESTRLQALQTQQQLGIQALSIANTGSQNILSLFR